MVTLNTTNNDIGNSSIHVDDHVDHVHETSKNSLDLKEKFIKNEVPAKSLHHYLITKLNGVDKALDYLMPNWFLQRKLDALGGFIERQFAPLTKFSNWLDHNGHGSWYKKLAIFLIKLPMRPIRNIVSLIYNIVREACYAAVHPLKAINKLVKFLISLINELTKPENWSKIGSGMIGASFGQSLVTGNPFSIIGVGIGSALLAGGLTIGPLKDMLYSLSIKSGMQNLGGQLKQIPESALTGFCMGLLVGAIQKTIYEHQLKTYSVTNYEEAKNFADSLVKEYNLPEYTDVELNEFGKIVINWNGNSKLDLFQTRFPELFETTFNDLEFPSHLQVVLEPGNLSQMQIHYHTWVGGTKNNYFYNGSISDLGMEGRVYPCPPENVVLSHAGSLVGTNQVFNSAIKSSNH